MNNQPLISVIIPVYNGEKYIERSMMSIINQPRFDKMELIVVNDGSSDQSGMIADAISEKYSSVRVIHKENGGVSAARNDAIAVANGLFLGFCDADDWWEKDFFDNALVQTISENENASKEIDIYGFSYNCVSANMKYYFHRPVAPGTFHYTEKALNRYNRFHFCSFLFRSTLIKDSNIQFLPTKINEDQPFVEIAYFMARGSCNIDKTLYNYWSNYNSCLHTADAIKTFENKFLSFIIAQEYFQKQGIEYDIEFSKFMIVGEILPTLCACEKYDFVKTFFADERLRFIHNYCSYPLFKHTVKPIKKWLTHPFLYFLSCKAFVLPKITLRNFLYRHPMLKAFPDYVFYKFRGYKKYTPTV